MRSTALFTVAAVLANFVSALPTSPPRNGTEPGSLVAREEGSPTWKSLPIHWKDYEPDGCGVLVSCFRKKKPKVQARMAIALNVALSTKYLCHYDVAERWGKSNFAVYVLMPIRIGGKAENKYHHSIELQRDLSYVFAESNANNRPFAVLWKARGKVIFETASWRNWFGEDSRPAPSLEAYTKCVEIIDTIHDKVYDRMKDHALWEGGVIYGAEVFSYQSSVLWSDDWSNLNFVNWDYKWVREMQYGNFPPGVDEGWLQQISHKDLRVSAGTYKDAATGKVIHVPGQCDYFKQGQSWT